MSLRLSVRGFKSIRGLELELGDVTVLLGHPASGKSNLLEALEALGYAVRVLVEAPAGEYPSRSLIPPLNMYVRAVRCLDLVNRFERAERPAAEVALEDPVEGAGQALRLECLEDPSRARVRLRAGEGEAGFEAALIDRSPPAALQSLSEILRFFEAFRAFIQYLGAVESVGRVEELESAPARVWAPRLYGFDRMGVLWNIMYGATGSRYPFNYVEERAANLGWILYNNDDLAREVNEVIAGFVGGLEIEALSDGRLVFRDHGKDVGAVSISDTVLRVLYALAALLSSGRYRYQGQGTTVEPLVMLEEPEAHLYPLLYHGLVEALEEPLGRGSRIILTTHSGGLAERLWERYNHRRDVKVYFVYRGIEAETRLYRVVLPDILDEVLDLETLISQPRAKIDELIEAGLLAPASQG